MPSPNLGGAAGASLVAWVAPTIVGSSMIAWINYEIALGRRPKAWAEVRRLAE